MKRIHRGAVVLDQHGRRARVARIERVPLTHDLFGDAVPGHLRAVLVYPDLTWANDVPVKMLRPAESAPPS